MEVHTKETKESPSDSYDLTSMFSEPNELRDTQSDLGEIRNLNKIESRASHRSYRSHASIIVDEPPNGGLVAWLQVLAAFMCNVNAWGIINSFGEFQDYYSHELLAHESPFRISWIGCLTAAMAFIGTVFFGALVDRGYQRSMILVGTLVQSFSLMMLSLCKEYWQVMLCQGLLFGVAASMSFLVGMGTVAPWFTTKRPLAVGCAVLGSSIGGTVFSAAVHKMLSEIGFGWSVRVLGFIVLVVGIVPVIVIRPRLPPRKGGGVLAFEVLEEPIFLMFCLGGFLAFSGFYQFYFYFQSWGYEVDPTSDVLPYLTSIMNACSIVGRLAPSVLVRHIGAYNVLMLTETFSAALSFAWIGAKSRGSTLAVGIIYAMVSGPLVAMPPIIVSILTPNMNRIGVRLSFAFLCIGGGCLIGAPFTGMLIRNYGWIYGQLYCALTWVLGLICIFGSRYLYTKGKFTWKA